MVDLKKNLFIIGNGFDIAHGIPSKYSDFQKYVRSLYMTKDLIDKSFSAIMPWKFDVPRTNNLLGHFDENAPGVMQNVLGFIDYCLSRSQNPGVPFNFYINSEWWSVEEFLGKVDIREFFCQELDEIDDETDQESLLYDIAECFKYVQILAAMWAKQIDVSNVKQIRDFKNLINDTRLLPIKQDFCISFNYTPTLEIVYGFKNVIHVHGIAGKRVMLGHSPNIDIDEFCDQNSIPVYCKHAAEVLLDATKKDTEKNASQLSGIIRKGCVGITDIYSYGFSFAEVDLPYIALVCSSIDTNDCVWHLLDFDSADKRNHYKNMITKCGFKGRFETYHVKTKIRSKKRPNVYRKYIIEKKKYLGKRAYYLEQFILLYNCANYSPTTMDWILFFPRLLRCFFFALVE